jgi:hypothetical protein
MARTCRPSGSNRKLTLQQQAARTVPRCGIRVFSVAIIATVPYSVAVSKLPRPFLFDPYFFIAVRLPRRREKFTEPDSALLGSGRDGADSVLWSLRSPEGTYPAMRQGRRGGLWIAPLGHGRPQTPRSTPVCVSQADARGRRHVKQCLRHPRRLWAAGRWSALLLWSPALQITSGH